MAFPTPWLVCVLLGLLSLVPAAPVRAGAAAQLPESPQFKVVPVFGNRYRDGEWLTVQVQLRNGSRPWQGDVRATLPFSADRAYTYSRAVDLEPNAETSFFFYLLPSRSEPRYDITLHDTAGVRVSWQTISLEVVGSADYMVGILADPAKITPALLPRPTGFKVGERDIRLVFVPVSPNAFPTQPDAFKVLDALIIGELDPERLDPEQWNTLSGWVADGGRLWLSGSPAYEAISRKLGPALLPATTLGQEQLNQLVPRVLPETVMAPVQLPDRTLTIQHLEVQPGSHLAVLQEGGPQSGLPLMVGRTSGRGVVISCAMDLNNPPFIRPGMTAEVWGAIIQASRPAPEYLFLRQSLFERDMVPRHLAAQPPFQLPDPTWYLLGFSLLISASGFGSYILCRKFNRPFSGFALVPALTLSAGLVVWLLWHNTATGQITLSRVTLAVYGSDRARAIVRSFAISTALNRDEYVLELKGSKAPGHTSDWLYRPQPLKLPDATLQSAPPRQFIQEEQTSTSLVQSFGSEGVQLQNFAGQGTTSVPLKLEARLAVLPDGTGLAGTITNRSGWNFKEVTLVLGENYFSLGDFGAGELRRVNLTFKNRTGLLPRPEIESNLYGADVAIGSSSAVSDDAMEQWRRNLRWNMLNSAYLNGRFTTVFQNYPLYFSGWLEGSNAEELTGQARLVGNLELFRQEFALVIMPLAYSYQPAGSNQFLIPAASLTSTRLQVVEANFEVDGTLRIADGGSIILQYRLPEQVRLTPDRLSFFIKAGPTLQTNQPASPRLEIYNWSQKRWDIMLEQGEARSRLDLRDPAQIGAYFEPDGAYIRVRASARGNTHTLEQLNLEVEGHK